MRKRFLAVVVVVASLALVYLLVYFGTHGSREHSKKQIYQTILHETAKNPFVENSACGKWFRMNEFVVLTNSDLNGSSYGVVVDSPRMIQTEKALAFAGQVLVERFGKNWEIICKPDGPSSTDDALTRAIGYLESARPAGLENQLEVREATRILQRELDRRAGQYAETSHELLIQWMSAEADILKETSKKELEELKEVRGKRPAGWEKFLKK